MFRNMAKGHNALDIINLIGETAFIAQHVHSSGQLILYTKSHIDGNHRSRWPLCFKGFAIRGLGIWAVRFGFFERGSQKRQPGKCFLRLPASRTSTNNLIFILGEIT